MKVTGYFEVVRSRSDRAMIRQDWIERVINADGRIRRWAAIGEAQGRYLRVVLLADGETVHNAFFDRSFKP